jgi:hypothetical protein
LPKRPKGIFQQPLDGSATQRFNPPDESRITKPPPLSHGRNRQQGSGSPTAAPFISFRSPPEIRSFRFATTCILDMKRFFLARALHWCAIAALLMGTQPGRAQTWIRWSSAAGGNNHFYALTPSPTNWTSAQSLAVSWGGTLATITSSNEQNFINTTFLAGAFEHLPLWIGLIDPPAKKGTFSGKLGSMEVQIGLHPRVNFQWVTGEPFSYSNWKPGEPNNSPPGENYVAINWEYSDDPPRGLKGDWNDTPLNGTTGYGGKTDGPYFGLVERETDPSQPPKRGFAKSAMSIGLFTVVAAILVICFARFRRHEKPTA